MTELIQPQNHEKDLKLALDGYYNHVNHDEWFTEIFQKDIIQNSWDAKKDKKHGHGWNCTILFNSRVFNGKKGIIISDSGTKGLIGRIPTSQSDLLQILKDRQTSDRLAFFLSSQWSEHEEGEGGSRGRGKILLLAASQDYEFYFDSLRFDDDQYIFGRVFLDENKEIKIKFNINEEGRDDLKKILPLQKPLTQSGTRIFIPNPRSDLEKSFRKQAVVKYILKTWWEILEKYNAEIIAGVDGNTEKVNRCEWLPPSKIVGEENFKEYPILLIQDNLKIKRIALGVLKGKNIPDNYRGIHIQRAGMIVESIDLYDLVQENWSDKIYGVVEFEPDLEEAMKEHESVEHYNFFWTHNPPRLVRQALRQKVLEFAKEHHLLEENAKQAKEVKEAESNAEKFLNKLAKKLNLGGRGRTRTTRKSTVRQNKEKIRISIKDLDIPLSGRFEFGEVLRGAYAIPINEYENQLKVQVTTYIYEKNTGRNVMSASEERLISLSSKNQEGVGWKAVPIDKKNFNRGAYIFKAKMISLEETKIGSKDIEKGEELYHPISGIFWVDQNPEEEGFFDVRRSDRDEKEKFFWWRNEGSDKVDHYVLYWNGEHPIFKEVRINKVALESALIRFGSLATLSVAFSKAKQNKKAFEKIFTSDELRLQDFDDILKRIVEKWGLFMISK